MDRPLWQSSHRTYVDSLMRKNSEALGFLPLSALDKYAAAGNVWLQYENDEPCGYLVFGYGYPVCKVVQCCIQADARRRDGASRLIEALVSRCNAAGYSAISLRCADDLEANGFWQAMGFVFTGQELGGQRRGRRINRWVLPLLDSAQPDLFGGMPIYQGPVWPSFAREARPGGTSPQVMYASRL